MSDFSNIKTYNDSYLYKTYKSRVGNNTIDENKNNKVLTDFVNNAIRIEKDHDGFIGIIEEVKRQQTSTVVLQMLLSEKVQLCLYTSELPRSFKVFEAKDPKNNRKPVVFIDCSGLIEFRNGYYICKKIDVFITYLYNAAVYMLYRYGNTKLLNNTEITISATACYVSLFSYIIDYLRIIGYSENKEKIKYLIGLYFLKNLMGKEFDQYCKNIAAKNAGVDLKYISAYDLYLEDGGFDNIEAFINLLSKTFNLRGLTLEVFVSRWIRLIGTGTQYAIDLFTSFGVLLTSAYSGTYIVNQKQIERGCGVDLVKFNNALKRIALSVFGAFHESTEYTEKYDRELAKCFAMRNEMPPVTKVSDFNSIEEAGRAADALKDFYIKSKQKEKLPKAATRLFNNGIIAIENYVENGDCYEEGAFCTCCKGLCDSIQNNPSLREVINDIKQKMSICQEISMNEDVNKEIRTRAAKCTIELRESLQYI